MNIKTAVIVCETGERFTCCAQGNVEVGAELVFNTSVCGYQEIITDPSYAEQAVVFTTAHVGNTGINSADYESQKAQVSAVIISNSVTPMSNWRAEESLLNWLAQRRVPVLFGCDTRALTILLRTAGSLRAWITTQTDTPLTTLQEKALAVPGLEGQDLAQHASCNQPYKWTEGTHRINQTTAQNTQKYAGKKVIVYDFGVKHTILRLLVDYGADVEVVPAQTPSAHLLEHKPDGVLLSNGPGDPSACDYAIENTQALLAAGIPLFGICLGHQILCLALGARTIKMPFGHHGANHPVQDSTNGQVAITSQNHGFVVDPTSIADKYISHLSLFDGSLQGVVVEEKKAIGFQGHPEASPGPADIRQQLFNTFFSFM